MIKDEKSNFFIYKKKDVSIQKHAYTCKCMSFSNLEKRNLFCHL